MAVKSFENMIKESEWREENENKNLMESQPVRRWELVG